MRKQSLVTWNMGNGPDELEKEKTKYIIQKYFSKELVLRAEDIEGFCNNFTRMG